MRASRISRETSKLFSAMPLPVSGPRRSTRSSLGRFAYRNSSPAAKDSESYTSAPPTPDVEDNAADAPSPAPGGTSTTAQKRKRTTTVTVADETSPAIKTEETDETTTTATTSKPRRARLPARTRTSPTTGARTVIPPSDWEEVYAVVKTMRQPGGAAYPAPVETMGCERLALASASARDRRFQTLVALMLSSQTKDTVTSEAMARLHKELPAWKEGEPPGLTLENILAVEEAVLNGFISKVGFHNNKAKYIKQAAILLRDHHNSDIPPTIEGLTSLPGVGPKMAHLCMSAPNGWGRVEGIGVDVHVHRITNLWGWNGKSPTRTPEETRLALQSWLPRDRWREINGLLVGLGQVVCLPVGRRCGDCELGLRGLCRAADRGKVALGRKKREEVKVKEGDDGGEVVKMEEIEEVMVKDVVVNEKDEKIPDIEDVMGRIKEESPKRRPKRSR